MAESSSVVLDDPHTTDRVVIAAAGFLAGYSGRTREAHTLDLRQLASDWRLRSSAPDRQSALLYTVRVARWGWW